MKNRLVLIDFWTYCCINCMHVMPLLRHLESKYPDLLVIGVHSAKFSNEKSANNIKNAAKRHLIEHPIACDNELVVWSKMEINCWPTLMLLNPRGHVIAELQGELQAKNCDQLIEFCFKYYANEITRVTSNIDLTKRITFMNLRTQISSELSFPGKLCLSNDSSLLFISDSGNSRVLVIDTKTKRLKFQIGRGIEGYIDGGFNECCFNFPQGLCYDSDCNVVYLADTGNNLIRKIDLNDLTVSTVCGKFNGVYSAEYDYIGGKKALDQMISSPWDLALIKRLNRDIMKYEKYLLVACAGSHQIWLYSFETNSEQCLCRVIEGSQLI